MFGGTETQTRDHLRRLTAHTRCPRDGCGGGTGDGESLSNFVTASDVEGTVLGEAR